MTPLFPLALSLFAVALLSPFTYRSEAAVYGKWPMAKVVRIVNGKLLTAPERSL